MYINPRLHKPLIALGGVVAGVAAGWTGSYFRSRRTILAQQELIENYADLDKKLEQVTEELRRRTEKAEEVVRVINEFADKPPIIDEMKETLEDHPSNEDFQPVPYEAVGPVAVVPPLELIKSVFPDEDDKPEEWNQEAENAARQEFPGRPYIISYEEFSDNAFGFSQKTVTFYEGDEVLVDEHDVPIYDVGTEVGPLVFGKGSGDPNICYVRNKRSKQEYEVIRDPGHFAIERQGLDIEEKYEEGDIRHSAVLRMRRED